MTTTIVAQPVGSRVEGSGPPGMRGSALGVTTTAAILGGAYLLLIGLTIIISFAHLSGYTLTFSGWSLAAYKRIDSLDFEAITMSLFIACALSVICVASAICTISLLFWIRRTELATLLMLPGFLCCPALRSIALPTLVGHFAGQANPTTASAISIGLALVCGSATAFPLCLAICLLGASGRMARYLDIYRNLGGSVWGALHAVVLPVLRPSMIVSFLVATPAITFDPYSLRVAGAQVLPSAGALITDLRSASDWPLIAVICLLALLVLLPIYALLLPGTMRNSSLG